MRGLFFGYNSKRNQRIELENPHPVEDTGPCETGDAGKDGYTVLSRARPDAQGNPPAVAGTKGPVYWGNDFEQ